VAQAAIDGSVWLFSSSEAIANLQALLPQQSWSQARAIATHARIGQAAKNAGFSVVCESRPVLASVVASIESMP
jgi:uroporphyrinogen-III synthase